MFNRISMNGRLTTLMALAIAFSSALSHPVVAERPVRYDDHKVVTLDVRTQRDLRVVIGIGAEPMACRIGIGEGQYVVSPRQLEALHEGEFDPIVEVINFQAMLDLERALIEQARLMRGDTDWFAVYRTAAEVDAYIDELFALRPDLVERLIVGDSVEGRPIHAMRITAPGGAEKPAVLFNGGQHAREWISIMVSMYIADQLVRNYETDPRTTAVLDNVEVYIVPLVNPDGYEFSQLAGNRMWRKNRRNNPGSSCFGVDLNRNWDAQWGGPHSTSTNPCSDIFIGSSPNSEPEVAALAAFMQSRPNIAAHIDIHNYSELVLHAWGYTNTPHPEADNIVNLAQLMSEAIYDVHGVNYPYGTPGQLLYMVSGSMQDWSTSIGAYGYTIEVRPSSFNPGFLLPPEEILPTSEENFAAAMVMAEWVAQGVVFSFPGGLPEVVDASGGTSIMVNATAATSGPLDQGSATLWTRAGAASEFQAAPMTHLGGSQYEVAIPPAPCGAEVEFYFSIDSMAGASYQSPLGAPGTVFTATSAEIVEQTLLAENFAAGLPAGWNATGLWQTTSACPVSGACEPQWVYYGQTGSCSYDVGQTSGVLTSPAISIPALDGGESAVLRFCYNLDTENHQSYDIAEFSINSSPWVRMAEAATWTTYAVDVSNYAGQDITLRWRFDTVDDMFNNFRGWQVTDVAVTVTTAGCPEPACPADLTGNGEVGLLDLLALIHAWGTCGSCPEDLTGNGEVGLLDLLVLISAWGPCPK